MIRRTRLALTTYTFQKKFFLDTLVPTSRKIHYLLVVAPFQNAFAAMSFGTKEIYIHQYTK